MSTLVNDQMEPRHTMSQAEQTPSPLVVPRRPTTTIDATGAAPRVASPVVPRRRPEDSPTSRETPAPSSFPASRPVVASPSIPTPPASGEDVKPRVANKGAFRAEFDTATSEHAIKPGRSTPPERSDPAGAWSMRDLGSACPLEGFDAASRLDPYWDGLWGQSAAGSWMNADLARAQSDLGVGRRLHTPFRQDPHAAVEQVLSARGWQSRLALLGSLFSWRTLTAEQAAAFVGDPNLAVSTHKSIASLFASGLVDLGIFSNNLLTTKVNSRGALYRPAKGDVFEEQIQEAITWPEHVAVTGGQKWAAPSAYDRHNVLATELALRLAEYTEVGTVLGERFSTVDHLAGSGIGYPEVVGDQRAADLTAVRSDGMRIAFEMTASTSTYFQQKVNKWARLLAERPFDQSGLTVVFVTVEHPERLGHDNDGRHVRSRVYQAIAAACRQYPGSVRDRVAERIGVATWREWFPARGLVHDAFFTLRVDRPTGSGEHLWEPCDMLDATDGTTAAGTQGRPFVAEDREQMTAVLTSSALLGGTPHWVRARFDAPPLWPLLLDAAGSGQVPSPTPVRPERAKGRALGSGVGAAGDAKPPKRLLGLAS